MTKKILSWLLLGAMVVFTPSSVWAHSESGKTTPAHQSTVTAPKHISIQFSDRIKITKFVLLKIGGDSHVIRAPKRFINKFTAPINKTLDGGDYKVEWQGLGIDGHATKGSFNFTVKP